MDHNISHSLLYTNKENKRIFGPAVLLLSAIARSFRCYSDPNDKSGNAEFIGSTTTLPILRTKSYWKTAQKLDGSHELLFVLLSGKTKKYIMDDFKGISSILKTSLMDKYAENMQEVIFIINGNASELQMKKIVEIEGFKNTIIIDRNKLIRMLSEGWNDGRKTPRELLIKEFVKYERLTDLANIYDPEAPVSPNSILFIKREYANDICKRYTASAIYGARRIGKSTICNQIQEYAISEGDICVYWPVTDKKIKDLSFKNEFKIALIILEKAKTYAGKVLSNKLRNQLNKINIDTINDQDDLKMKYFELIDLLNGKNIKFWIILDEVDRYIKNIDKLYMQQKLGSNFEFFKFLKDLNNYSDQFRFIVSGFMEIHKYIEKGVTSDSQNPFKGLWNPLPLTLLSKNEAIQLLLKLETQMALEFESEELVHDIINKYVTCHPSFLQYFSKRLLIYLNEKITSEYRMITREDVLHVIMEGQDQYPKFTQGIDTTFLEYVNDRLHLNLDSVSSFIIYLMADEPDVTSYDDDWINNAIKLFFDEYPLPNIMKETALDRLEVTMLIEKRGSSYQFVNPPWKDYLKHYINLNQNLLDDILYKIENDLKFYEVNNKIENIYSNKKRSKEIDMLISDCQQLGKNIEESSRIKADEMKEYSDSIKKLQLAL